jgi:cell division septation protein DedD
MKHAFGILTTLASAIALTSCGNQGTSLAEHPAGTGPFDSRGNYVEAWADNPEKWNRGGGSSRPATNRPKPEAVTPPVIARQEQPPPDAVPIVVAAHTPPAPRPSAAPRPTTTQVRATPKPAPKPKPKPAAPTRYVIKKGDSLYAIAQRNKTTVAALQRANGIKGSIIHPGKTLVIPR